MPLWKKKKLHTTGHKHEKGATCATLGRGNISGLRKDFPNIIKIFPHLQKDKLCSVILSIEQINLSLKDGSEW